MNLAPISPPVSRNASEFASPPPTPASKPSDFYSQSAGSTSSWASSGPSSKASTPRTSTDELPTPKTSKHARKHSKTSTDGFRRARTRTLSRVKKRYVMSHFRSRCGIDRRLQRQGPVHAYRLIQQRSRARLLQTPSLKSPSSLKSVPQVGSSGARFIRQTSLFLGQREGEIVILQAFAPPFGAFFRSF